MGRTLVIPGAGWVLRHLSEIRTEFILGFSEVVLGMPFWRTRQQREAEALGLLALRQAGFTREST